MKTRLLIIIAIAATISGLIIVLGNIPEEPVPEPEGGNPKLTELMETGGFIVETRTLRFPERTYTTLANAEDTKNEWFIVNGVLAFGSETHEVIIPTILDLYTDDGKVTSVMSYVSLEETIEYAKTLELNSGYIDLNDYVDPNWIDGPTETLDEVPQIEPEPEPEPIISKVIDPTKIVNANNQFAIDFYSQVTADKEENVFFSPWSITNAFAIAYEGARGNTADEMSDAFGFVKDDEKRRNAFASIHEDLNQKNAEYKLHVANALWIAEGFELFKEYVDTAKTYYDSEVDTVNFETNGADIINEWVKNKTEEKIEELFDPDSLGGVRLVITNAIYFNGTWAMPFDEKRTSEQDFIVNAQKIVKVPMMSRDSYYNYTDTDELQILELPYLGDRLSMLILLPNDVDGIKSIEESLSAQKISQWNDDLLQMRLFVQIPKFTMETDYNLIPELKKLGINAAFGPADFSGISNADLFISQAVHKAFVDVNEVGTEAAAATGIVMLESMPPSFMADHPFVFIIQDKETGVILFMGKVVDPTA